MELLTLSLENFQGLKHEEIQLDGHSASIYGRNASGKTTIFNAITWLLFGKPSTWAKNWDPKTKGPNGDLHNLEHSATGTFRLDDGQTVTLKKVFREVWKRKRGSAAEEYSGNTIDYQINGVPCKEKEYMAAVQEYCSGEETMKLLTMPDYFSSVMDWQKRREILLDICGDVSDADVIASTPELAGLPEFLKMPGSTTRLYKVDEYRKIAAAKKTDLNKKIEAIPNRIDEASRAIDKDLPTPEDLAWDYFTWRPSWPQQRPRKPKLQRKSGQFWPVILRNSAAPWRTPRRTMQRQKPSTSRRAARPAPSTARHRRRQKPN